MGDVYFCERLCVKPVGVTVEINKGGRGGCYFLSVTQSFNAKLIVKTLTSGASYGSCNSKAGIILS